MKNIFNNVVLGFLISCTFSHSWASNTFLKLPDVVKKNPRLYVNYVWFHLSLSYSYQAIYNVLQALKSNFSSHFCRLPDIANFTPNYSYSYVYSLWDQNNISDLSSYLLDQSGECYRILQELYFRQCYLNCKGN